MAPTALFRVSEACDDVRPSRSDVDEQVTRARACFAAWSALTGDDVQEARSRFEAAFQPFTQFVAGRTGSLRSQVADAEQQLEDIRRQVVELQQREIEIQAQKVEVQREIAEELVSKRSERLIVYTLLAWSAIIALVIVAILRLSKAQNTGTGKQAVNYPMFLELVTVFVLTASILILGLAGKIGDEALAALIGGISGYVLGRLSEGRGARDTGTTSGTTSGTASGTT